MSSTNKTALITGASSGIGTELAKYHAQKSGDLVLVARREKVLNDLKAELEAAHKIKVHVIAADLSDPDSASHIFETTQSAGIQVDYLINNAGFGGHGRFHERDLQEDLAMIQVNITSLVSLTNLYLKEMTKRKKGKILHVASTAAFIPGPLQAVYYATKSFALSFSQAIAQELSGTGITSTALCPGAVATEFAKTGNLEDLAAFDQAATPASVAKCGYDAMEKGKLVIINEKRLSFMLNWLIPFMSRKRVLKLSQSFMEKQK